MQESDNKKKIIGDSSESVSELAVSNDETAEKITANDTLKTSAANIETVQNPESEEETPQQLKRKKIWKIVSTILFVVIIVAIIVFTAVMDFSGENVDIGKVFQQIGNNWYYLLVLLGLFFAAIIAETFKVMLLIQKTTGKLMPIVSFNCVVLGRFYDNVTPFSMGGQPFQIYYLTKHGVPGGPAGAIPIGSFFLTQFVFFILAVVSFIVGVDPGLVPIYIQIIAYFGSVCTVAFSLFIVVFSFFPKAGHRVIEWGVKVLTKIKICRKPDKWIAKGNAAIDNNKKNMEILLKSKRALIAGTFLSVIVNLAVYSMPYFTLLLFPNAVSESGRTPSWEMWFEITRVTYFIYCAVAIIPTPGNSGAADGTFYGLFKSILTAGTCFAGMMIWRVASFYSYILLGVVVTIVIKIAASVRAKRLSNGLNRQ